MHYINCLEGINDFSDSKRILSEKGLIVKEYDDLYLVKYDKNKSNMKDLDVLKCRGLILEKNTNKVVCAPPQKSTDIDYYHNIYENNLDTEIIFEEFIDGTMINLFKYKNGTYISTRSCLGANCRWNSSNTFNTLFNECIEFSNFDNIDENLTLSFIIQHPDNTIVKKYVKADIKLCVANRINEDNSITILNRTQMTDILQKYNLNIEIPKRYSLESMEQTYKKIDELDETDQGIILKNYNENGDNRSKIRNINYNKIRFLRGNTNNKQYLYFQLRKNQNVQEYLDYFPEDKEFFDKWRFKLYESTTKLFNYYRDLKVNKTIRFLEIDYEYRPLINELHAMYQLDNKITTKQKVIDYLHKQPTPRLLFILNYKNRKTKNLNEQASSEQASSDQASSEQASSEQASSDLTSNDSNYISYANMTKSNN